MKFKKTASDIELAYCIGRIEQALREMPVSFANVAFDRVLDYMTTTPPKRGKKKGKK